MVTGLRLLSSVELFRSGAVSLGRAAEVAGVTVGQMMTILTELGVENRIQDTDYRQGLESVRKAW